MTYRHLPYSCKTAVLSAALLLLTSAGVCAETPQAAAANQRQVLSSFGRLPLSFEANVGQTDSSVRYLAHGKNYNLFLTSNQAVIALTRWKVQKPLSKGREVEAAATVRMTVTGANPHASVTGMEEQPGVVNYFHGNDPSKWKTGVATYAKVKYTGIYPGVDLLYYGPEGRLEYDFAVAPGADPAKIHLTIDGAKKTSVDSASGDLVLETAVGQVRFNQPVLYQPGALSKVEGRFVADGNSVAFQVGTYDHSLPLIIDPQLVYSTYLGGSDVDDGVAIAVNAAGNAYVTGGTCSVNFPVTQGAYQTSGNGTASCYGTNGENTQDVFVTKLNVAGTALVYSTYLGGSYQDYPTGLAIDTAGNAYIGGYTASTNFPITAAALQTTCGPYVTYSSCSSGPSIVSGCSPAGGAVSGFITKLNPTGSALVYSTFIGGSQQDYVTGLAIDSTDEVYVSGESSSLYGSNDLCQNNPQVLFPWPMTGNAYQNITVNPNPGFDVYPFPVLSKLSANGNSLVYSTAYAPLYSSTEELGVKSVQTTAIAVDSSGYAHMAGYAQQDTVPGTQNGYQPLNNSGASSEDWFNGWIAIFNTGDAQGASLLGATMFGGNGISPTGQLACYGAGDDIKAIALDSAGNNYITGTACSANFPTTAGVVLPADPKTCGGTYTGFAAKLNALGTALDYSTFLGGAQCSTDNGASIAVGANGTAYITGQAGDDNFPEFNALSGSGNSTQAPFIVELNPTATNYIFASYLGSFTAGSNGAGNGIAVDDKGNIYVTGMVQPNPGVVNFPITSDAFQHAPGGLTDAFISKIGPVKTYLIIKNTAPSSVATGTNLTYAISVVNGGPDTSEGIAVTDVVPAGTVFLKATSSDGTCTGPAVGSRGEVTCATSTLAKDAGFEIHLTVRVTAASGNTISDVATVNSDTDNTNSANNMATATTSVD